MQICKWLLLHGVAIGSSLVFAQAASSAAKPDPPIPMPKDRMADSYAIYSGLMPIGETAGTDWPHSLWLVQDATVTAIGPGEACNADAAHGGTDMNPHMYVKPSDGYEKDFQEILNDFDQHCHEHIALAPDQWNTSTPVRLLSLAEQQKFQSSRMKVGQKDDDAFKGAPAIYGFSEVYFNTKHTVALVYVTHWCGSLCGQGFWVGLALQQGHWNHLRWSGPSWIS